ncbi:MAG: Coenzyme F420 hydrogenase/dehydrogenase, beta subunit C-terminal domain [Clostridia bacterium]|nr:Coenzyme F420 hydrogenase/dehydrogenase, beta subunit C-terminal domain [Clostridia bacterium]
MIRLCEANLCTGCTACSSACPHGCISMQADAEGFVRPVVDETRCIGCGLCTRACPVLSAPDKNPMPTAFAAKNREESIRFMSTSGGIFTLLAKKVLDQGGVVIGAGYDADFKVEHQLVDVPEMLPRLRGAKYAQSDLRGVFPQIKTLLSQGQKVLFSGTPCQVSGLRAFLGKDDPNLLLVDLVCHGVPSPAVWEKYLSWRSERNGDGLRPATVNLRSKNTGWSTYSVDICWPYGKTYAATNREDPYIRAFVGDLCLRPSCYRCSCKGLTRCADFTLGDYWGVWDQVPSMSDNKGTSIVLVHSDKARALWKELAADMTVTEVDPRSCMEQNPAALRSAFLDSENRALFMHRYENEDFDALVQEILPKASAASQLAQRVAGKLKRLLKF